MNQILFEMYIGVITNFQKEPDYGHYIYCVPFYGFPEF